MMLLLLLIHLTVGVLSGLSVWSDDKPDIRVRDLTLFHLGEIWIHVCVGVWIGVTNWVKDLLDFHDLASNAVNFLWLANTTTSIMIPTWRATKSVWATLKATLWDRLKWELLCATSAAVCWIGLITWMSLKT